MSKRGIALRNLMRGLLTEEQYENAVLQIDLGEMGIKCPTSRLPEMRSEWKAFCMNPLKYAGTPVVDMVKKWLED